MSGLITVMVVVGVVVGVWFFSVLLTHLVLAIITAPDLGPFGLHNRVFDMVLDRDYLSFKNYDNCVRLITFGGFLAWIFFLYVLVRDQIEKAKKVKA